ncbi:MAG TPA: hypothetical protein VE338_05890 [Ktedonobacterales bacterium]|nr:hypothetical protein [Ktedonobacterales bacterium]
MSFKGELIQASEPVFRARTADSAPFGAACEALDRSAWARCHPHCQVINPDPVESLYVESLYVESLYVATPHLTLPGITNCLPGASVFRRFAPARCLTAAGATRRIWRLPSWFYPSAGRRPLSYHRILDYQMEPDGQTVLLHSAAPGQEFVLDCEEYPEALPWLARLFDPSDTCGF